MLFTHASSHNTPNRRHSPDWGLGGLLGLVFKVSVVLLGILGLLGLLGLLGVLGLFEKNGGETKMRGVVKVIKVTCVGICNE